MRTTLEELKARLENLGELSRRIDQNRVAVSQKIAEKLSKYFLTPRPENAEDFYDLLLAQKPVPHSSYDARGEIAANFNQRVHIPGAECSRKVHDIAAFFKEHKDFQPLIAMRQKLQLELAKLKSRNDITSENHSEINELYAEANKNIQALTGVSLQDAKKEKWESETLLGTSVNLIKYFFKKDFRRACDYIDRYREQYGFSIFDLPEKNKLAKTLSDKTRAEYNGFDFENLRRCSTIEQQAQRYGDNAPHFVIEHIAPLFGNAQFLKDAQSCLDSETIQYAAEYHTAFQKLKTLELAMSVLRKAIYLEEKPADSKPDSGGSQAGRELELSLELGSACDHMIDIIEPEHQNSGEDICARQMEERLALQAAQEHLRQLHQEALRLMEEQAQQERMQRLREAMERSSSRGFGRGSDFDRGGYE